MFGNRLRELREARGLSQEELADKVGSSEPQIWRYEHNKGNPTKDVLERLADFFGVSVDELLGRDRSNDLSAKEIAAITAWRRGDKLDAMKMIMDEN
jgi:transcriptional regulator with XRE-family HTH domain